MAPPAAGEPSASAAPEPAHRDIAKRRRPPFAGAGARLLSLGVRAAVMAAALALFLLFAAAAVILLLSLFVAARAFRHHHHHGGSRYRVPLASPPPPPPSIGLSPAELRLLPCFASSSSSSPRLCAVCLEGSRPGERWRALPACGHAFHARLPRLPRRRRRILELIAQFSASRRCLCTLTSGCSATPASRKVGGSRQVLDRKPSYLAVI